MELEKKKLDGEKTTKKKRRSVATACEVAEIEIEIEGGG